VTPGSQGNLVVSSGQRRVDVAFGRDPSEAETLTKQAFAFAKRFGVSGDQAGSAIKQEGNVVYYTNFGSLRTLERTKIGACLR
jgi:hypothetical protein